MDASQRRPGSASHPGTLSGRGSRRAGTSTPGTGHESLARAKRPPRGTDCDRRRAGSTSRIERYYRPRERERVGPLGSEPNPRTFPTMSGCVHHYFTGTVPSLTRVLAAVSPHSECAYADKKGESVLAAGAAPGFRRLHDQAAGRG